MAIEMADVMLDLTPPDTLADGTLAEVQHAYAVGTPVVLAPPGSAGGLEAMLADVELTVLEASRR